MPILAFKPVAAIKKLMAPLDERSRIVLECRFGIGPSPERQTLESIGGRYGITRERVRQIENAALETVRKHPNAVAAQPALEELQAFIEKQYGGVGAEHALLERLSSDRHLQNHFHFLLVFGRPFVKIREDDDFYHTWATEERRAVAVHEALRALHKQVLKEGIVAEAAIFDHLKQTLREKNRLEADEETLQAWLEISKAVGKNILGEWGHVSSPVIRPRGMKDLAFLVLKKQGSPMHFSEVSKTISELFDRSAHSETVHNELIKDHRFVLVGRGLYALESWGYKPGVIREVIKGILRENGPLSKEEVIKRVLKERYVKENTILVNLQNKTHFSRDRDRRYTVA